MHITIKRTKRRKTIMIQVKDSLVEVRAPSNIKPVSYTHLPLPTKA